MDHFCLFENKLNFNEGKISNKPYSVRLDHNAVRLLQNTQNSVSITLKIRVIKANEVNGKVLQGLRIINLLC